MHTSDPSTVEEGGLLEFKASPVCRASSNRARATTEKPSLKNKTKQKREREEGEGEKKKQTNKPKLPLATLTVIVLFSTCFACLPISLENCRKLLSPL